MIIALTLLDWRASWHDWRSERLLARSRAHDAKILALEPAFRRSRTGAA